MAARCAASGSRLRSGPLRSGGYRDQMSARVIDDGMRAYYAARAPEYDDWWLSTGLFASRDRPGWTEEVDQLIRVVESLPAASVLDVACGTGFLTRHLRGTVTAIDQSDQMVAIASARLPEAVVAVGDAVPLMFRAGAFDRVFTSHFYGHLQPDERTAFLAECRRVGRELVIVDSAPRSEADAEQVHERVLNDGSRHQVFKRFFRAPQLAEEIGGGEVLHDGQWFVVVASKARA